MNDPLHQFVAYHEIGRARVLVYQERLRPRLHALNHVRRLRGAAAGVLGIKSARVLAVWQVIDKHGNVRLLDAAAVLGTDFHGRRVGNHVLAPVPGNVIVHAQLQRL